MTPTRILLQDRLYRHYWLSFLCNQMGSWVQNASLAWLVLLLTGSAERLGLIVAMGFLPSLLFGIPAGVIADRWPRDRILVTTQSLLLLLSLGLCLMVFYEWTQYEHVVVFSFLYGTAVAFDLPARQSFNLQLVKADQYPSVVALNSLGFNLSRLLGPSLAGLMIAQWGIRAPFWLNTLSYLPYIWMLHRVRSRAQAGRQSAKSNQNAWAAAREGLAYAWQTPAIRQILLVLAWISIFGINFQTLVPAYAQLVLHLQAGGYGFLMAALGAGALIGSVLQTLTGEARLERIVWGMVGLSLLQMVLWFSFPPYSVAVILGGLGFAMVMTLLNTNTTIQTTVPDQLRGRVMAVYVMLLLGCAPIGAYLTGCLFELCGGQWTALILGTTTLGALGFCRPGWSDLHSGVGTTVAPEKVKI